MRRCGSQPTPRMSDRTPDAVERAYRYTVVLILVVAAALRFWGLANGLPHPLTRPDEEVLLNHLGPPARGDFDLQYAVYPSLYFYVNWIWSAGGLWLAG